MFWPRQLRTSSRVGGLGLLPLVMGLEGRPSRSTLRWKWVPALPPATAASSVPRTTATRAIRPPVVSDPSPTGMRGSLRLESTLYFAPEEHSGDRQQNGHHQAEEPNGDSLTWPVET